MHLEKEIEELRNEFNALSTKLENIESKVKSTDPVEGEGYLYIDSDGVVEGTICTKHPRDVYRFNVDNYFHSIEEATHHRQNIEVEIKLRALIKRINKEPQAPKVFPDWSVGNPQSKCYLFLDTSNDMIQEASAQQHNIKYSWEYCYRSFIVNALEEIGRDELAIYYRSR